MRRGEFITLLGSAAVAWPIAARAQQAERVRRIGALGGGAAADDPDVQARMAAFLQALQQLGWTVGRNVRIDYRAGLGATRTVPIVFTVVADPVGAGFVDSLARPGGNATGFISLEYGLSAKWLELLKEFAPSTSRAAVLRDAAITAGIGQFAAIQTAAPSLGIEVSPVNVRDASEIERAVVAFARSSNGGLIVTGSPLVAVHRELITTLATRHNLPAVYANRFYVTGGGLMSYGADLLDQHRRAASYVDRILKGEKPADLPVQAPTKYELAINLKTAKTLGLTIPPQLLARADEVIE